MASKEDVHENLRLVQACASAALQAVSDPERHVVTNKCFDLRARLKEFVSILTLVYQHVTKLAIALKPSNPTFSTAILPAKELAGHLDALASCACSVDDNNDGKTLVREIRWGAEDVLKSIESLISVYMNDTHYQQGFDDAEGNGKGAPYLVRTGVIHEAIDRARNVSSSNAESVRRKWSGLVGGIEDCQQEVEELLEDDAIEKTGGATDTSPDDGGWDDLLDDPCQAKSKPASEKELARLTSAGKLFKFTRALFRKIDSILFVEDPPLFALSNRDYDGLLQHASATLRTSDELVNALYIPQNQEAVAKCVASFDSSLTDLRSLLGMPQCTATGMTKTQTLKEDETNIQSGIANLALGDSPKSFPSSMETLESKHAKWLDVCFEQMSRIILSLDS